MRSSHCQPSEGRWINHFYRLITQLTYPTNSTKCSTTSTKKPYRLINRFKTSSRRMCKKVLQPCGTIRCSNYSGVANLIPCENSPKCEISVVREPRRRYLYCQDCSAMTVKQRKCFLMSTLRGAHKEVQSAKTSKVQASGAEDSAYSGAEQQAECSIMAEIKGTKHSSRSRIEKQARSSTSRAARAAGRETKTAKMLEVQAHGAEHSAHSGTSQPAIMAENKSAEDNPYPGTSQSSILAESSSDGLLPSPLPKPSANRPPRFNASDLPFDAPPALPIDPTLLSMIDDIFLNA